VEAPTERRSIPDQLREAPPPVRVTTKLRKVEIEALVASEKSASKPPPQRLASGLRRAVTDEALERYELRERRETVPAPPPEDENEDAEDEDARARR
jgi:hypothetical protein